MKTKTLSPRLVDLQTAERELYFPEPLIPIGQRVGGLAMYSNAFRRGAGENVFGSDENGIWLGAANFEDAPFSVDMAGNAVLNSVAVGNYLTRGGANQPISGQLIVGGSVNGSLLVKDSSNVTKITLDNTGITILDGKLVIKNDSAVTTIDAKGIVSGANFSTTGAVANSLNQTGFSDGVSTDITGATLTFTLGRALTILFLAQTTAYLVESAGNATNSFVALFLDGVEISAALRMQWFSGTGESTAHAHYIKVALAAGTHTIKLVGVMNKLSGSPNFNIYSFSLSYAQLGT